MTNNDEKKLILLVDDAPANIQVAREILKDSYKIRVATERSEGHELVKRRSASGPDPSRHHDAGDGWL